MPASIPLLNRVILLTTEKSVCSGEQENTSNSKLGAGRPLGTIWSMEKAYFDLRHRYPGREDHAYLRLALQSRYPEKGDTFIEKLLSDSQSLDDAIFQAIGVDFGSHVGLQIAMNALWRFPPCSRCGKYRALSTTDDLCYGCRKYPYFRACNLQQLSTPLGRLPAGQVLRSLRSRTLENNGRPRSSDDSSRLNQR